jgi:hypothetical protein
VFLLQGKPIMSEALEQESEQEGVEESETESVAEPTRKRRRFKPAEVAMAQRFKDIGPMDEPIPFMSLDRDMKLAVFPSSRNKLIDRGVIQVDINEETGQIESVSINSEIWSEYESDLTPVVPTVRVGNDATGEFRQRKPRTVALQYPHFKIHLISKTNPRRVGSHAYYNWEYCYGKQYTPDGEVTEVVQSVPEYLSMKFYPRTQFTSNGTYFDGPSMLFVEQDIKSGYIGIYDSTIPDNDPVPQHFLTPSAIKGLTVEVSDDENESEAEPGAESQTGQSEAEAAE